MPNSTAKSLIRYFNLNQRVMKMQLEGLSHSDSLIQPPFRGNCLNWVLGHIICERNTVLEFLEKSNFWGQDEISLYEQDSQPIMEDDEAMTLDDLVSDLDRALDIIIAALEKITPKKLETMTGEGDQKRSIGDMISFYIWHETYHIGQLELLRQLSGKGDKVL